jgi:hypothetical protein
MEQIARGHCKKYITDALFNSEQFIDNRVALWQIQIAPAKSYTEILFPRSLLNKY